MVTRLLSPQVFLKDYLFINMSVHSSWETLDSFLGNKKIGKTVFVFKNLSVWGAEDK